MNKQFNNLVNINGKKLFQGTITMLNEIIIFGRKGKNILSTEHFS